MTDLLDITDDVFPRPLSCAALQSKWSFIRHPVYSPGYALGYHKTNQQKTGFTYVIDSESYRDKEKQKPGTRPENTLNANEPISITGKQLSESSL
jgi:hypothetical protein